MGDGHPDREENRAEWRQLAREVQRAANAADLKANAHALGHHPAQVMASEAIARSLVLPEASAERKEIPLFSGVMAYFPAALAEVARVSFWGNEKHNPGEALHHARGKSSDHADCIARHLLEHGQVDTLTTCDGRSAKIRHSAALAWRALALLQEELEAAGAPLARGARLP